MIRQPPVLPSGVRLHGAGYQVRVYVAGAGRSSRAFPLNTPIAELLHWQADERHRLQLEIRGDDQPIEPGTFADDARRYLKTIAAMKDHKGRTADVHEWVALFGTRRRSTITAQEIRAARDRWMTVGPKWVYRKKTKTEAGRWEPIAKPLSGSTVNHRLRALSNLYRVLDGPQKANPVRAVPEAPETAAVPRMVAIEKIEALIAALSDRGKAERHQRRSTVSHSKIRIRVMAWTGLAPAQLIALKRADVDLEAGTMRTQDRKKGAGAEPVLLPLLPHAVDALRDYDAAGLWTKTFSTSSVLKSFKLAAHKVGLSPSVRVYDLRHSFGSRVYIASGNLAAVGELLQHQDPRTTRRYLLAAVNPVLVAALAPLQQPRLSDTPHAGPIAGPTRADESGIS